MPAQSYIKINHSQITEYCLVALIIIFIQISATDAFPSNTETLISLSDSLNAQARIYSDSFEYEKSLADLRQVLAIEVQVNRPLKYASILVEIARVFHNVSQYDSTIMYCDSALALARSGDHHRVMAEAYYLIGDAAKIRGDYQTTFACCDTSIAAARRIQDATLEANALCLMGEAYHLLSEYDQARSYFDSSLTIARAAGYEECIAKALFHIGTNYDAVSNYRTALDYYRLAYARHRRITDIRGEGLDLHYIGRAYYGLGQYDSALVYYKKALLIRQKIQDLWGQGRSLCAIGLVRYMYGQYDSALFYYDSSLIISREVGDKLCESLTLNSMGVIHYEVGTYNRALAYYDSTLSLARATESRYSQVAAFNNIGSVHNALSMYENAYAYFDSALMLSREIHDRYSECLTLNNLAIFFDDFGQYNRALAYYDSALAVNRQIKARHSEATILHNMSNTHRALGHYNAALAYCDTALSIERIVGNPQGEARTYDDIGAVYHMLEDYNRALAYFDSSLTIKKGTNDRLGTANTLRHIGYSHYKLGNNQRAFAYYDSALVITQLLQDRRGESNVLDNIGQVYEAMDDAEGAISYYKQAIEVKEEIRSELRRTELREPYIEAEKDVYQRLAILLIMLERYEEAFDYLERSRSERLRRAFEMTDLVAFDPSLNRTLERINLLTSELEGLRKRLQDGKIEEAAYDKEHHELQGRLNQIMLDFKIHHTRLYNVMVPQPWILKDIQKIIPDSTLFIGFTEVNDKYVALLFTKRMFMVEPLPGPRDSIDQWIMQALTALKWHAPEAEIHEQFAQLYQLLLKPSETELEKYQNIVFIPYGILHYVPFHILRYADEKDSYHYLMEEHRISYLPSASFLTDLLKAQEAAPQELLAFGNADGTLPSAEVEVDMIAQLFDRSHVCKCDSARKDRFIEMANDYELIHLATHGILSYDPRFSYIVLAPEIEGNLTVREIFGLSGHFQTTSLVTLSACETAVEAEPEAAGMELVTLSNAFKVAGVPTTIASLWEIADRSTAVFMEHFYKNLKDNGMDKLDALRTAQLSMLDHEQYAHPYYWAPFILIGDWQ